LDTHYEDRRLSSGNRGSEILYETLTGSLRFLNTFYACLYKRVLALKVRGVIYQGSYRDGASLKRETGNIRK